MLAKQRTCARVQAASRPAVVVSRPCRRLVLCRAEEQREAGAAATEAAPQQQQEQQQQQPPAAAPAPNAPVLAKGQGTAIVTGAISLICGVLYLALVFFLDRGEMLPPPPEAYLP